MQNLEHRRINHPVAQPGEGFGAVGFLRNFRRKFFYYCVQSIYSDKVAADKCKRCKVYNKSCPSKPLANDEQEKIVKFLERCVLPLPKFLPGCASKSSLPTRNSWNRACLWVLNYPHFLDEDFSRTSLEKIRK